MCASSPLGSIFTFFAPRKLLANTFRISVLHQRPKTFGIIRTTWTIADLSRILKETGQPAGEDVIRTIAPLTARRGLRTLSSCSFRGTPPSAIVTPFQSSSGGIRFKGILHVCGTQNRPALRPAPSSELPKSLRRHHCDGVRRYRSAHQHCPR